MERQEVHTDCEGKEKLKVEKGLIVKHLRYDDGQMILFLADLRGHNIPECRCPATFCHLCGKKLE